MHMVLIWSFLFGLGIYFDIEAKRPLSFLTGFNYAFLINAIILVLAR